jgi:hypothetical protein
MSLLAKLLFKNLEGHKNKFDIPEIALKPISFVVQGNDVSLIVLKFAKADCLRLCPLLSIRFSDLPCDEPECEDAGRLPEFDLCGDPPIK